MAALGAGNDAWTAAQTRAQFRALAWLRWRVLLNGLRRKGGKGDLVANLLLAPLTLLLLLWPSVAAGVACYFAASGNRRGWLLVVIWAVFALSQLVNVQIGQAATTFNPTQLIRFPVTFRIYTAMRLFFGLLAPANMLVAGMSLGVAVGTSVAWSDAAPGVFAAMAAFALANILFTRMLFTWVDRWLSTRRTREVFTAFIFLGALGFQWLNVTFNPAFHHGDRHAVSAAHLPVAHVAAAQMYYTRFEPVLGLLPPGLTARALFAAHERRTGAFCLLLLGSLAWSALFFAIFAVRLYSEFRGESLSEAAVAIAKPAALPQATTATAPTPGTAMLPAPASRHPLSTGGTVAALFAKEVLTLRRNTGMFYGLVAPLVLVMLFAGKLASHSPPGVLFGGAVAYVMLGIGTLSYNSFGMEGAGVQFYFFAPVGMRDVFLAKNLVTVAITLLEVAAVFAAISFTRRPPTFTMTLSVTLWAIFAMLISLAEGNRRSITAPKAVDPQKPAGRQASPLSAMLSVGLLLLAALLGAGVYGLASYVGQAWVIPAGALVLAAVGAGLYGYTLRSLDALLSRHREGLVEQLAKAG